MKRLNYINKFGNRSSVALTPVQFTVLRKLCKIHGFGKISEYIKMVQDKGIKGNLSMAIRDWMLVELSEVLDEISKTNHRIH